MNFLSQITHKTGIKEIFFVFLLLFRPINLNSFEHLSEQVFKRQLEEVKVFPHA
jgi:hypothetical protein